MGPRSGRRALGGERASGEASARPRAPGRRRALVWAAAVFAAGFAITLTTSAQLRADARSDARQRFAESSDQVVRVIQREVNGYVDELGDIGSFRAASPYATDAEFDRFVRGTGVFERLPSLTGIVYLELVPDEELGAFLEDQRERDPDFDLLPVGAHPEDRPWLLLMHYVPGTMDLELPRGADVSPILSISDAVAAAEPTGASVVGSFQ